MKDLENKIETPSVGARSYMYTWTKKEMIAVGIALAVNLAIFLPIILYKSDKHQNMQWKDCDTAYYKPDRSDSTITRHVVLWDFNCDGSYDWKTVYTWKKGVVMSMETTAKKSYYDTLGIQENRQYVNIVPDTTKINWRIK